jgi:hypothetical protein
MDLIGRSVLPTSVIGTSVMRPMESKSSITLYLRLS